MRCLAAAQEVQTILVGCIMTKMAGVYQNTNSYFYSLNNVSSYIDTTASSSLSVFLVSDGGTTLSSINDPTININNPNAPINMADVSAPAGVVATGLMAFMLGFRRKKGIDYV